MTATEARAILLTERDKLFRKSLAIANQIAGIELAISVLDENEDAPAEEERGDDP